MHAFMYVITYTASSVLVGADTSVYVAITCICMLLILAVVGTVQFETFDGQQWEATMAADPAFVLRSKEDSA